MKALCWFGTFIYFFTGCASDSMMREILNNQYFEKTAHEDSKALYIGEWTAATPMKLTAIKINETGNIKMCTSKPQFEITNGKISKENEKIKMIFEVGFQYEVLAVHKDYLIIDYHGHEYKFYSGKVPDNCRDIFDRFVSQ